VFAQSLARETLLDTFACVAVNTRTNLDVPTDIWQCWLRDTFFLKKWQNTSVSFPAAMPITTQPSDKAQYLEETQTVYSDLQLFICQRSIQMRVGNAMEPSLGHRIVRCQTPFPP
jgi:hypothetical protein